MPALIDLSGAVVNTLRVTTRTHRIDNGKKRTLWRCECQRCGVVSEKRADGIRRGKSMCECQIREKNLTHGDTGCAEYRCWRGIKTRCFNKQSDDYARYGGAGITMCDRWRQSYENFFADMGRKPSDAHSIDRIDNSGSYEPANCRWATYTTQNNNTTQNTVLTLDGVSKTVAQWGRCNHFGRMTILNRLNGGWSVREALTLPLHSRRKQA